MEFDKAYFNLGYLDRLSYQDSFIHRLDPRTKLISTLAFAIVVVSFPKYEVAGLLPFFLFPVLMLSLGDIPLRFLVKRVLVVSPFALFVGIFNPVVDRHVLFNAFGIPVSAGWVSFFSIMLKFTLTISVALLLVATTSFPRICHGLQRLGAPSGFTTQLLFLYRYLFVLLEEALRVARSRDMRAFGGRGTGPRIFVKIIGTLFIRTVERAERVYSAMLSRGFLGEVVMIERGGIRPTDVAFLAFTAAFLYSFRTWNVTVMLGRLLGGGQ